MQHEAALGSNGTARKYRVARGDRVRVVNVKLLEQAGELQRKRTIDDNAQCTVGLCSQISVTVVLKFGSAMPGMAISS